MLAFDGIGIWHLQTVVKFIHSGFFEKRKVLLLDSLHFQSTNPTKLIGSKLMTHCIFFLRQASLF